MFKTLLTILMVSLVTTMTYAQTIILDFESIETSTTFQSFGGNQEGVVNGAVENPNPSGINTSANVLTYTKGGDAPTWGGAFSNPVPSRLIDFTATSKVCVKVHMNHIGNVALKFEDSTNGGGNWLGIQPNTKVGEWEEICFDVTVPSAEAPTDPADGNIYSKIVLFIDFGTEGTGEDVTTYLDDFIVGGGDVVVEPGEGDTILDFETEETSTMFQSFGGNQEGVVNGPISNPNPSGINTSAMVMPHVKAGDAPTWGGAFSNPNPSRQIDLVEYDQICIKVHKDHTGNLTLKLEEGENGAANWLLQMPTTKVGEWEEICFDANLPSGEDPAQPAKGSIYNKIVFFMDFGEAGTGEDVTSYLDDFVLKTKGGAPETADVTFSLNTNNLSDVSTVHLSGQFNGWCADCAPMSDDNSDGIYDLTVTMDKGAYEYKFVVNGVYEDLLPSLECVKTTDFTNRLGVFVADTELPTVALSSCYDLGAAVNITFRLGFPAGVVPADSVYLAGGGNFEAPGGRYRMTDNDGDNIYEITVERLRGFSSYYTFANGNCPGFDAGCKEDIAGQDCAQADNFNDRWLPEVNEDTVIETCYGLCSDTANCLEGDVNVTFAIDMNGYDGMFSTVHVSGNFNNDCADCDVLSNDGNGIYTATLSVPVGALSYKYVVDGVAESFARGSECGANDDGNRNTFVTADTQMDATCFNSCYACGQGAMLIFRLGIPDGVEAAEDGVYLAGGGNFGAPGGRFQMMDNGNGIYEITIERAIGFSSYYTFANGNCPGFDAGCKEDIAGQDCAQADNFNDRWLPGLTGDTVIETCYGECSTSTECMGVGIDRFNVDNNLFNLAPNFTKDFTKLTFSGITAESKSVKVFDGVGRLVFATELDGNELQYSINTSSFTNGMYFVHVQVGNTLGSQKLMKY